MNKYQRGKAAAREAAKEWQRAAALAALSWADLAEASAKYEKLARRYGLTKEFKENGII